MCEDIKALEYAEPFSVKCWIWEFQKYLKAENVAFPIEDPAAFDTQIKKWLDPKSRTSGPKYAADVGYVKGVAKYTTVSFRIDLPRWGPRSTKEPAYDKI